MKILFLADNFPPETNAVSARVYERALHWVNWGHEVTVVTSVPNFPEGQVHEGYKNKWRQVEFMEGIRVVRVKTYIAPNKGVVKRTIDFLSYLFTGTAGALFEQRPDIVAATSPQFFVAVAGFAVSLFKRCPFVLEIGDLWPASIVAVNAVKPGFAIRQIEKLELFLYRRAERVVLLTESFKKNLVRRGIQEGKLDVVRNGVDLSRFSPLPKDRDAANAYGLNDKFVVGYVGTHGMAHNLSNVVRAAERTRDSADIVYLFVGSGAEKKQLIELVETKALNNVLFLPRQPKDAMPLIWSLCDLALVHLMNSPAMQEVIPSKMFEAMGMGLPVLLVSPRGEASELLTGHGAGVHVPAGHPVALAEAIVALKADPELVRRLSEQSLAAAPAHSREQQARSYLESLAKASNEFKRHTT